MNHQTQDKFDKLAEKAVDVVSKSLDTIDEQPTAEKLNRAFRILELYASIKGTGP